MKSVKYLVLFVFAVSTGLLYNGCGSDTTTNNTPTTGTVNGKVVDVQGNPITGVTVSIGSTIATTGTDGSFTVNSVTTPYNVKLVLAPATGIQYQGITTLSPQLYGIGLAATPSTATLTVNIPALGVNQKAAIIYTDNAVVHSSTTISNPSVTGTVTVTWQNAAPITGKVIVLVYTVDGLGNVTTYDKYGEKPNIALNAGGSSTVTFTGSDLNITPSTATITGSITAPAGYNPPVTRLTLKFTAQGTPLIGTNFGIAAPGTNFSFKVPQGLSSSFTIGLQGSASAATGEQTIKLLTGTIGGSNAITLETPPVLSTPVNAATNIDTTTNFTFTGGTGTGIYIVQFQAAGKSFDVFTGSTTITIPSFSSFGLSLGSGVPYTWQVLKIGTMASVNDLVSSAIYNNASFNTEAISQTRTFTSAP